MKYFLIIIVGAAAVALGLCALAGDIATGEQTPVQASTDAWRVEWRGQTRYMKKDGTWHVWSPSARWVPAPAAVVAREGLD